MPEAMEYIPEPNSKAAQEIEHAFADEAQKRNAMLTRNWDWYNGDIPEPLNIQQDGYNDNVVFNYVEAISEKLSQFLVGDGVTFDAGADDEDSPLDEAVKMLWRKNQGDILMDNLALTGSIEGHLAVRLEPAGNGNFPRLVRIQQKHFAVFWDTFDMAKVLWYRLQAKNRRIDYVKGGITEDGVVMPDAPIWTERVYEYRQSNVTTPIGRESPKWVLLSSEPWAYEFPPIIDWQDSSYPNEYYGRPGVGGVIKLNKALNFIMSNTMRIVKHFAHPKTIGLGFDINEILQSSIGGVWSVDKPRNEIDIFNLEMASDGALAQWLTASIVRSIWRSGGVVDPETVKDKVGEITNFGLRVLFADSIRRTDKRRLSFATGLDAINRAALVLAGYGVPEQEIEIIWPDVLPEDEDAEAVTLMGEFDRGIISKQTYRERRGYNNELEENRIADEAKTTDIGSLILQNRAFSGGQ